MSNCTTMEAPSSATTASDKHPEERAIEAGFVAHGAWAFEAAYFAYRALLYGTAYSVLANAAAAEDCVHDVLLRLWERGHAYTPARGSLRGFLCVCVRNEALSRSRTLRNRSRITRERFDNAAARVGAEDEAIAGIDLHDSLTALTAPQQEAIRLAYYEGLTHEEIAHVLNEPVGTVKSRISSALRRLRTVLAGGDNQ